MLIKTTPKCCHIWMLLFSGSRLTQLWESFETVTLFLQSSPAVIFLICDSTEVMITQQWRMSGLTSCLTAITWSLFLFGSCFTWTSQQYCLVTSVRKWSLIIDGRWREQETFCTGNNKLSLISLYFRSLFDLRKLCGEYIQQVFIPLPPVCKKKKANWIIVNC